LAVETAGQLEDTFGKVVWFVPLADLTDARHVPDALVSALHLPRSSDPEPLEKVVAALSSHPRALLVLDNYEQLVDEGALLVRILLLRVPHLTCLVTSRRLLRLEGEREFPVPPLATPAGAGHAGATADVAERATFRGPGAGRSP
jgi:predicted ATPase